MGETTDPLTPRSTAPASVDRDDLTDDEMTVTDTVRPASDRPFVTGSPRLDYAGYASTTEDEDAADAPVSDEVEQARADIEQTRAQMTETIDAIKEKLSPANLVAEAKESVKEAVKSETHSVVEGAKDMAKGAVATVSDAVSNVVDSAKAMIAPKAESARESLSGVKDSASHMAHRAGETAAGVGRSAKNAGGSIVDTIKLNPVPAALTGFGLGWLLLSMRRQASASGASGRYDYDAYNGAFDADNARAGTGTYRVGTPSTHAAGAYGTGAYEIIGEESTPSLKERASDIKDKAEALKDRMEDKLERVGDRVETRFEHMGDAIKANPLPAALAGLSLGWLLYSSLRGSGATTVTFPTVRRDAYGETGYGSATRTSHLSGESEGGIRGGLSHAGERVGDAASAVKDTAAHAASAVGGAVSSAAGTAKDAVSSAAGAVGGAVSTAAGAVGDAAGAVKDKAGDIAVAAKDKAGDAFSGISTFIHEQPLAAAAVALGTGILAGLLLPNTRKESELLGPTRDRLLDQAQDAASDMLTKAQNVAHEAADTARQSARTHLGEAIVDSLTGATSASDSIKDTAAKIKNEVKDTVRTEAQNQGLVSSS